METFPFGVSIIIGQALCCNIPMKGLKSKHEKENLEVPGNRTCDKSEVEVSLLKLAVLEVCSGKQKMVLI